jgi:hypothetical protein
MMEDGRPGSRRVVVGVSAADEGLERLVGPGVIDIAGDHGTSGSLPDMGLVACTREAPGEEKPSKSGFMFSA